MSDLLPADQSPWNTDLHPVGCATCGQAFLVEEQRLVNKLCPHCVQGTLVTQNARVRPEPPELVVPFTQTPTTVRAKLDAFVNDVWLKPSDFTTEALLKRLTPLFWPMWLVDATVRGNWQGEVGFDYQVKSTQENYDGGWRTQEVVETRIRWEPRLGELERRYDNVAASALVRQNEIEKAVGAVSTAQARTCTPDAFNGAVIRLPDLPPESAWPPAQDALLAKAARECAQAAAAQHSRQVQVQATYDSINWTQMLLPLYVTYYVDDAGQRHAIWINGLTGQVAGRRLASGKTAQVYAGGVGCGALGVFGFAVLFLLVGIVFPPILLLGGLTLLVAVGVGLAALVPMLWAWNWNAKNTVDLGVPVARAQSR